MTIRKTCAMAVFAFVGCQMISTPVTGSPTNVILFIGDGMATSQRMVAEELVRKTQGRTLEMNHLPHLAMTRTCSANSLITDSSAAATAIACGLKTNNGYLGVDPSAASVDEKGKPIESCAVYAKRAGCKVGIVTTVPITHATPGGFYAHNKNRRNSEAIARDLANSGFDFFAGGGLDVNEKTSTAYRVVSDGGYRIVKTRDEFLALKPGCGKILTRFENGALDYDIDRKGDVAAKQPSLSEIVRKSIELLDNEKGFFLMVEGGRIDWSGHANDAATNARETLAFSDAVDLALAYQKAHPETLVIVTGDHETGGLSMGNWRRGFNLPIENLTNQTVSAISFDKALAAHMTRAKSEVSFDSIKPLLTDAFGFAFAPGEKGALLLDEAETALVKEAFEHDRKLIARHVAESRAYDDVKIYETGKRCSEIISRRSGLGWTSNAHTGQPVMTTAKGPCAEKFNGLNENTDISKIIKAIYR